MIRRLLALLGRHPSPPTPARKPGSVRIVAVYEPLIPISWPSSMTVGTDDDRTALMIVAAVKANNAHLREWIEEGRN